MLGLSRPETILGMGDEEEKTRKSHMKYERLWRKRTKYCVWSKVVEWVELHENKVDIEPLHFSLRIHYMYFNITPGHISESLAEACVYCRAVGPTI